MDIRFGVFWKQNLGSIYKDNSISVLGKEATVNIDLQEVSQMYVNFKVKGESLTDKVTIVDVKEGLIRIPFKTDVIQVGLNELEVVAVMKNGDVLPSQTYSYMIDKSLENPNAVEADTNYPVLIELLDLAGNKLIDMDKSIQKVNTSIENMTNEISNYKEVTTNALNSDISSYKEATTNELEESFNNYSNNTTSNITRVLGHKIVEIDDRVNAKINEVDTSLNNKINEVDEIIEEINKEVESTTGRQVDLENTFDQLVINAGNSNAEIVDARVKSNGTSYSKLGDRLDAVDSQLDAVDSQLEHKSNIKDVRKSTSIQQINISEFDEETKKSITGGSVAVVGKKSVNDENVVYSSLNEDKLSDCTIGKNLINPKRIKYGFYMSSSTGVINSGSSSTGIDCISDYIYINSAINSKIICNKPCGYVFFDSSLNYISGRVPSTGSIDIPLNATYVVVNMYSSTIKTIQLEYGDVSTSFESYNYKLEKLNIEEQFKINDYNKDVVEKANVYLTLPEYLDYKIVDVNSDNRGCLYLRWDNIPINIRPINDTYDYNVTFSDESFDNVTFETIDGKQYVVVPHVHALVFDITDKKLRTKSHKEIDYSNEIELLYFAWMQVIKGAISRYFIQKEYEEETPVVSEIEQLYKNKTIEIQNNLFNTFDDILSYVQITDLHSDYKAVNDVIDRQLKSIVDLSNRNGFDFIALTGDITSGGNAKDVTLNRLTEMVEILKKTTNTPILFLNGNHDDNSYCVDEASITDNVLISKQEWFNRVIAPFRLGEIHDTQDKYSRYYYLDLPNKKVRLICLDASDAPKEYLDGGIVKYHGRNWWGYGNRQVHWLNEVLTDVSKKEGWNVVILSHMCARSEIASRNYVYKNGSVLENVITAFQNGTTYTGQCLDSSTVNCDFTGNNNKILAYHYGHNHASIRYKQNVDFLYSCTPNAYPSVIDSSIIPSDVGFKIPTPRTINTMTECCYDVFKLTSTNLISYRFGAGDNENVLI